VIQPACFVLSCHRAPWIARSGNEWNALTTKSPAATIREARLPGDPVSLDKAAEPTQASRQATVLALIHLGGRGDLKSATGARG